MLIIFNKYLTLSYFGAYYSPIDVFLCLIIDLYFHFRFVTFVTS